MRYGLLSPARADPLTLSLREALLPAKEDVNHRVKTNHLQKEKPSFRRAAVAASLEMAHTD